MTVDRDRLADRRGIRSECPPRVVTEHGPRRRDPRQAEDVPESTRNRGDTPYRLPFAQPQLRLGAVFDRGETAEPEAGGRHRLEVGIRRLAVGPSVHLAGVDVDQFARGDDAGGTAKEQPLDGAVHRGVRARAKREADDDDGGQPFRA